MKCHKCDKPATFHITEITGGVVELHFCEDCAKEYLTQGEEGGTSLGSVLKQQLEVTGGAEELAKLDKRVCPMCGISFYEFRQHGRLGCPHDYVVFEKELDPLLQNIHGEVKHTGKRPKAGPVDTDSVAEVIGLRREMKKAVDEENYERASELRDQIRAKETMAGKPSSSA